MLDNVDCWGGVCKGAWFLFLARGVDLYDTMVSFLKFKFISVQKIWEHFIWYHGLNSSFLGKNIFKHLDTLRAVTQCQVSNGQSTFFWFDRWLLPEPLATVFPALYSHHQTQHGLVSDILQTGVKNALRNRLTIVASAELASLLSLLQVFRISEGPDVRKMISGEPFSTRSAYACLHQSDSNVFTDQIWASCVPSRVKVFGWLVQLDRINTRANLQRKNIIMMSDCPLCPGTPEDRLHLFSDARRLGKTNSCLSPLQASGHPSRSLYCGRPGTLGMLLSLEMNHGVPRPLSLM
jgi:hypothetical protein